METECGLLFPPGDSAKLTDALIRLTDPDLRTRLGSNGRAAARDRYNWAHAASKLLQVYEDLGQTDSAATLSSA